MRREKMILKQLFEEFSEEVIRAFVQKNADYYLAKWQLMAKTGSKISWNWAAALFTSLWLFYRKMVAYGFMLFGVGFLMGFLYFLIVLTFKNIALIMLINFFNFVVSIAIVILLGIYGNYIYGHFTYKKLKELSLIAKNEEELKLLAAQKGGTSVGWVLLAILISSLLLTTFEVILLSSIAMNTSMY